MKWLFEMQKKELECSKNAQLVSMIYGCDGNIVASQSKPDQYGARCQMIKVILTYMCFCTQS